MFRAVGNRCAFDLSALRVGITPDEVLSRLTHLGFRSIEVDLVRTARSRIGVSRYSRGARLAEAPASFDCSSFIKWLYAVRGIWLPRRTVQQIACGTEVSLLEDLKAGDAVFTTGCQNYDLDGSGTGVGHVGFATGEGTVVHAADSRSGIVECPVEEFVQRAEFRGIRRHIPDASHVVTFTTPTESEVETSDDIMLLLRYPPRT